MFKVLFIYWILKISYDKNCGYYYVTSSHATGNAARDDRARFWNEKEEKKKRGGEKCSSREKKITTLEQGHFYPSTKRNFRSMTMMQGQLIGTLNMVMSFGA